MSKAAMTKTGGRAHVSRRSTTSAQRSRARILATRVAKSTGRAHGSSVPTGEVGVNGTRWTFLTNHTHVLILLGRDPSMVLREVASRVGITERAVQRIIADLEEGGILEREKIGRKNHYKIHRSRKLRHPIERHRSIGALLQAL